MVETLSADALNYMVMAGMFLGILMLFTGLGQLIRRGENRQEARNRRLRMIERGASNEEILALLKPEAPLGLLGRLPLVGDLPQALAQAGLTVPADRFLLISGFGVAAIGFVAALFVPLWQAVPVGLALGLVLPVLVVKSRRDERKKKLTAQLPDALELMARGLKVGHPLNASIAAVATEMPDPVGTEFGLVFDQINFGDELTDAIQDFADRLDLEDAQYLAASISIQHGTGGDLGRIISVLAKVIRNRIAMRAKIRAISSEGRLTAIFLSALPLLILGMTSFTSPSYFGGVKEDPLFVPILIAIAVLTLSNYLVLRKLVNFRI